MCSRDKYCMDVTALVPRIFTILHSLAKQPSPSHVDECFGLLQSVVNDSKQGPQGTSAAPATIPDSVGRLPNVSYGYSFDPELEQIIALATPQRRAAAASSTAEPQSLGQISKSAMSDAPAKKRTPPRLCIACSTFGCFLLTTDFVSDLRRHTNCLGMAGYFRAVRCSIPASPRRAPER